MAERDGVHYVTGDEMAEMLAEIRERAHPTPPTHPIRADLTRAVSLIAERVASGAVRHATGTELAAMRLALGVLRDMVRIRGLPARNADSLATLRVSDALRALALVGVGPAVDLATHAGMAASMAASPALGRLLRARLALCLRARLRMERGDLGPVECDACGAAPIRRGPGDRCERCWDAVRPPYDGTYRVRTRVTPLWELAPAHEVRR